MQCKQLPYYMSPDSLFLHWETCIWLSFSSSSGILGPAIATKQTSHQGWILVPQFILHRFCSTDDPAEVERSPVRPVSPSLAAHRGLPQVTGARGRAHISWNSCGHRGGVYSNFPDRLQRVLPHIKGQGHPPAPAPSDQGTA